MQHGDFDAVELEIQWQRLIAILAEAALTVVRTSFSKVVSDGNDFGCLLYDRLGRMVAQDAGVASKLAPSPRTVSLALERYPPTTLRPGDALITNDPWLCCGHLYDISVIKPLYHRGHLVGFAEVLAHVPDVGGSASNDSREVYEEGLCIPVVRLVHQGQDVPEVWAFIRANVRVPDQLEGDLRAFLAALDLVERRVAEFLAEYGARDLQPLADAIIRRSEEATRQSIRQAVPPGRYENRLAIDGADPEHPLTIAVAVSVDADGTILVDYTGSSPQSDRGVNCTEVYTYAWTLYPLRCLFASGIPYNHGLFVPIRMTAPPGSFLNPRRPAPVRMKSGTGNFIPFAIFGAMARVVPDRVMAESGIKCILRCFAIGDDGQPLAETLHFMGGLGARYTKDGIACMSFPAGGAETPVERIENSLPITVVHKRLIPDSGGPGRYRGGPGQEIALRCESRSPLRILVQNIRVNTRPQGYVGGQPGAPGANFLNGSPIPGKTTVTLGYGDVLTVRTPGGGGMFDPAQRPRAAVLRDVELELVTPEGARRDYGLDPAGEGALPGCPAPAQQAEA